MKRSEATREMLKQFRQERAALSEVRRQAMAHPDYARGYKERQVARLRQEHGDKLKVSARALYQAAQKNLSIAKTQLAGVQHDAGKQWDYQRLAFMQAEIQAKLAGTGGAGAGPLGGGALAAIAKMREAFETSGDFHGQRALRTVALPILATIKPGDPPILVTINPGDPPIAITASTLRRQFADDEASMRPAEVDALEADIRELTSLLGEVEIDIRQTEAAVSGRDDLLAGANVFGRATSDWDFEVFGKERPAPIPERSKVEPTEGKADDPPKQSDAEVVARLHSASAGARVFGSAAVVDAGAE